MAWKSREITVGELTAEEMEREASMMPPSRKEEADILRSLAKSYRARVNQKKILVWEEVE
jgi:hypothetical protein